MRLLCELRDSGGLVIICYNRALIMITTRKPLDIDLLLTLALCLFTLWPLLQQPGLPNGTDTLYHIYRVAEMDRSWSHGLLVPRWAETFYFGYGSPLFHYYASLSYFITSLLIRLTGWDAVNALRALIVLCMLGAGGGMFLFMRERVGNLAGVLVAVCYVYTPYIAYKEPYARGDFPELLAFALFPFILWRFEIFLQTGRVWVFAGFAAGLMVIAHNLMALVFTALLVAWLCWNGLARVVSPRRAGFGLAGVALGIGLTAYFWLPALAETSAVQFANLITLAELDYRNFFVPLRHLLAPSPRLDAGAINGLLPLLHLGQAQWMLALVGAAGAAIAFIRNRTRHAASLPFTMLTFFGVTAAALIFLVTPGSLFVWEIFRPLAFLQFPWRFIGPIAVCLAVLAGFNAVWIKRLPLRVGQLVTAVFIIFPVVLAMPLFYIPEWTNRTVDTSISAYHRAETSGRQMATTYSSEYLPVDVHTVPDPTPRLLTDYADGYPVDKAHHEALPESVVVELLEHSPQHDVWRVVADEPFTMEVLTFYFAGWQAEIDGVPAPIRPSDPHGLITFDVPAGDHTVRLFLGQTPARTVGIAISIGAVLIAIAVVRLFRDEQSEMRFASIKSPSGNAYRAGVVTGGVVSLALLLILMREGVMWVNSPPGQALVAQNPVAYNLDDVIHLIGYDLNSRDFRPGEQVELAVYWHAVQQPVTYGYASFVHISPGGPPLAQADKLNPAGRPTKEWTSDGYIYDTYVIALPDSMPPGDYQLTVGLYTCDTLPPGECGNGDRLEVFDAEGQHLGDAVPLGAITVR